MFHASTIIQMFASLREHGVSQWRGSKEEVAIRTLLAAGTSGHKCSLWDTPHGVQWHGLVIVGLMLI